VQSDTDRELVKRFQGGDEAAFAELVRRHQDRIFRLTRVRLHTPQQAADAAQDVFVRAYRGLRGFLFTAEPFTWLYRTMINVCNEYNRRAQREGRLFRELDDQTDDAAAEPQHDDDAETRALRARVAALPARQREVVTLRIFEDLSVEATARAMGCRPGTVKALLHKALANLRASTLDA
jgi:RNA polymerase sigma-70 factor (ECF subfamily)